MASSFPRQEGGFIPAVSSGVLKLKPQSIRSSLAWEKSQSSRQPGGRAQSAHTFSACCSIPCHAASPPACWGGASWAVGPAHGSAPASHRGPMVPGGRFCCVLSSCSLAPRDKASSPQLCLVLAARRQRRSFPAPAAIGSRALRIRTCELSVVRQGSSNPRAPRFCGEQAFLSEQSRLLPRRASSLRGAGRRALGLSSWLWGWGGGLGTKRGAGTPQEELVRVVAQSLQQQEGRRAAGLVPSEAGNISELLAVLCLF